MNNSVGVNKRFTNEQLFVGKQLNANGFGMGETGRQKAIQKALETEGSELIYQDGKQNWFAQELGEGVTETDKRSALSQVDQSEIKLHPTLNTRQGMHQAFISFADSQAEAVIPDNVAEMTTWQRLKTGNSAALSSLAHRTKISIQNPAATASDLAQGMVINTWKTLTDPQQSFDSVSKAYQHDKVDGVLQGAKVAGSVVASAAIVVGTGAALSNMGVKLKSRTLGFKMTNAFQAGDMAKYNTLKNQAQNVASLGRRIAHVNTVAGQVGKTAGLASLGVTSLSLLKNEVDLARADSPDKMRREIGQLSNDIGSLAQSASFYAVNKVITKLSEQAKKLYTENRNYKPVTPEQQAYLDKLIDSKSETIAKRVASEVSDFNPENWEALPETDKMKALNQINQIFAEEMNFKAPELKIQDMGSHSGFYNFDSHEITLGRSKLSSLAEMSDVISHEGFHGWQRELSNSFFSGDMNIQSELKAHIFSWSDNRRFTGYADPTSTPGLAIGSKTVISPRAMGDIFPGLDSYSDYMNQPLETGAWRMGNNLKNALSE